MEHNYHMYYNNPAKRWGDALPLGNGRLGAMVYGETDMERITLNDDSRKTSNLDKLYYQFQLHNLMIN